MLGALNKSKYGNCLNDNTPLLIVSDKTEDSVYEVRNLKNHQTIFTLIPLMKAPQSIPIM